MLNTHPAIVLQLFTKTNPRHNSPLAIFNEQFSANMLRCAQGPGGCTPEPHLTMSQPNNWPPHRTPTRTTPPCLHVECRNDVPPLPAAPAKKEPHQKERGGEEVG